MKQVKLDVESKINSKKQQYFQLPCREGYKEKNRYKMENSPLGKFGLKFKRIRKDPRSSISTPKVVRSDRMSIKPQEEIENKANKVSYSQDWVAYNQAQTQEKILFMELLNELTSNIPPQKYKGNGRPPANIGEMIFSICLKTYLDFSSRRIESDIRISQQLGYIQHVPHFNTILKYLNNPALSQVFKELITISAIPLKQVEENFAVDASGFSTSIFQRWFHVRTGDSQRRLFKKAHLFSGVKTNIITSVEVTDGYTHDTLMFSDLIHDTAKYFDIKEVSADMGYSSRENLGLVSKIGAIPFIPFKKNATSRAGGFAIWNAMYRYYKDHKEDFLQHYHNRSNAESVFSMMKRKQGANLRTKNDIAQVNEIMCKCLVHNICVLIQEMFEIGIKVDFKEVIPKEFMCKIKL